MPKLVGKKVFNALSGTRDISTPVNIADDYMFILVDPNGFTLNTSGFTTLVSGAMQIYYQKITTPITSINITLVQSVRDSMAIFIFRGVHGTDPFDGLTPSIAASSSGSGQTVTSATANTLAITVASDNLEQAIFDYPWETVAIGKNSSFNGLSIGMLPMPSAGTTPTPFLPAYTSNAFSSCTFVLRDDGSGLQHGHHDHSASKAGVILGLNDGIGDTDWTAAHTVVSSVTNNSTSFTCDGGISQVLNTTRTIGVHKRRAVRVDTGSTGRSTYFQKVLANGYQIPSFDAQGKTLAIVLTHDDTGEYQSEIGVVLGLSDGTNTRLWHASAVDTQPRRDLGEYPFVFEVEGGFELEDQGTVDATALAAIDNFWFGFYSVNTFQVMKLGTLFELNNIPLTGGTSSDSISYADAYRLTLANDLQTVQAQGGQAEGQYLFFQGLTVTGFVNFDARGESAIWASSPNQSNNRPQCLVSEGSFPHTFDVDDGSTVDLRGVPLDLGNYSRFGFEDTTSTHVSTTYLTDGCAVRRCIPVLNNVAVTGMVFDDSEEVEYTAGQLSDMSGGGNIFRNTRSGQAQQLTITGATQAALQVELDKINGTNAFNNCPVALRIEFTGTGDVSLTMSAVTFSGNTTDIHYNSTNSSALTIVLSGGSNASTTSISGSATSATISNDVTFTVNIVDENNSALTGAELTILTTGTQTEQYHVETSTASEDFTFTAPLGVNVDVQVYKPGYETFWDANRDLGSVNSSITATLRSIPAYEA